MALIKAINSSNNLPNLEARDTPAKQLATGIRALYYGFRLCLHPKVRAYTIAPLIVNILIFTGGTFLILDWVNTSLLAWLLSFIPTDLPSFLSWLDPIIGWLLGLLKILIWLGVGLGLLVVIANCFTLLAHTISAPFNAFLAEQVEKEERPIHYPHFSLKEIIVRSIWREISKLLYWIPRALALVLLSILISWIPIVNLITPALWALFGAWMLGMQYFDYSSDNNGYKITDTIAKMKAHRLSALGFGIATMGITLVPILNWFAIPSAVVGSTLLWVQIFDKHEDQITE